MIHDFDVLVIGAGAAGCRAALSAANAGARVLMVCKGSFGRCGTTNLAGALYAAALGHSDPNDDPQVHWEDTIIGGDYIGDQLLVRVLVQEVCGTVEELERYGVTWEKEGDRFCQVSAPSHRFPRCVHNRDQTGRSIQLALMREVEKNEKIAIHDEFLVTRLLVSRQSVVGAVGIDQRSGILAAVRVAAVVVATGGAGQLYQVTGMDTGATGDGIVLGYLAGAEIINPEMHQFYPTSFVHPESLRGISLSTSPLWAKGARLYNALGDRFMERAFPDDKENVPRDKISRAIYAEIAEGRGTANGGVWLEPRFIDGWDVGKGSFARSFVLPERLFGLNTARVEVAPTYHFTLAGLKIDVGCRTSVRGLFAAGEAAGGIHGANRIGGNALAECIVFGKIAGQEAAKYARQNAAPAMPLDQVEEEQSRLFKLLEARPNGVRPGSLLRELKRVMWERVGVIRDGPGLREARSRIASLREDVNCLRIVERGLVHNLELAEAVELTNMLILANAVVNAALLRDESRGAHFRRDYPGSDDERWLANIIARRRGEQDEFRIEPVSLAAQLPFEGRRN